MNKIAGLISLIVMISCSSGRQAIDDTDFTQYVNPFIGTGGSGHTFPGATVPLGMVQLSPNTGNFTWDYHSGYQFNDTTLRGFAHTHLSGGGNPVLGDLLILPFSKGDALLNSLCHFPRKKKKHPPDIMLLF